MEKIDWFGLYGISVAGGVLVNVMFIFLSCFLKGSTSFTVYFNVYGEAFFEVILLVTGTASLLFWLLMKNRGEVIGR